MMRRLHSVDPLAAVAVNQHPYFGHGKIEVLPKIAVGSLTDIATVYTPGVAFSVREIIDRPSALHELTAKDNTIGVVTDGSAVLGWGAVGPRPALPVIEGKAAMFKLLAGVDAVPLCLDVSGHEELVSVMRALEPGFGGFNLEDVAAPGCFEVMRRLEEELPVPCIHDDQNGTATVVVAALINACKVLGRSPQNQVVVINGAGAAGSAIFALLSRLGVRDIIVNERQGILNSDQVYAASHLTEIARRSNHRGLRGRLADALKGANVFVGVSIAKQLDADVVRTMARDPIVFALANPEPEIMPEAASAGGAAIVATGRFDYPNQCNNVLAFPALMRAALDTRAHRLDLDVFLAAAACIAKEVPDEQLSPTNILPTALSETLYPRVAEETARAIVTRGLARIDPGAGAVAANTSALRALVAGRQAALPAGKDVSSSPGRLDVPSIEQPETT